MYLEVLILVRVFIYNIDDLYLLNASIECSDESIHVCQEFQLTRHKLSYNGVSMMTRDLSELISNARHSWKDLFQLLFLVNVTGIIITYCFLG